MATRSRIGLELADGSILSAYAHWDGYPEWMGRILRTHYNTKDKVAELIDGGDMSSPWTEDRFSVDPTHGWKVLMSSVVVSGYAIICISSMILNFLKSLKFPLVLLLFDL